MRPQDIKPGVAIYWEQHWWFVAATTLDMEHVELELQPAADHQGSGFKETFPLHRLNDLDLEVRAVHYVVTTKVNLADAKEGERAIILVTADQFRAKEIVGKLRRHDHDVLLYVAVDGLQSQIRQAWFGPAPGDAR